MPKFLPFLGAVAGVFVLSLMGPANAAPRKADGIQSQTAGQTDVSAQRRHHRRHYRPYRYVRPYYAPYYGYGYPGYYRPYYGYPYYGSPGVGFSFRF